MFGISRSISAGVGGVGGVVGVKNVHVTIQTLIFSLKSRRRRLSNEQLDDGEENPSLMRINYTTPKRHRLRLPLCYPFD